MMTSTEEFKVYDRIFSWKNNETRARLYGRRCRIIAKGQTMHSALVEFEDGERVICAMRALKRRYE